jgi:hypothetical protein
VQDEAHHLDDQGDAHEELDPAGEDEVQADAAGGARPARPARGPPPRDGRRGRGRPPPPRRRGELALLAAGAIGADAHENAGAELAPLAHWTSTDLKLPRITRASIGYHRVISVT